MKLFLCSLSLVVGYLAVPVRCDAQQTPPDTKPSTSVSEDKSKSADQKTDKSGKTSEPEQAIPEETRQQRRERLRQNAVQGIGNPTSLLTMPNILRELKLSDRQIRDVQQEQKMVRIRLQNMYRGVRDLPRDQQMVRMTELQPGADKLNSQGRTKILNVLTDEQRERLWGISMQMRGPIALLDPEVAKLLDLTDEQIEQIMQIAEQMDQELKDLTKQFAATAELPGGPKATLPSEQRYAAIRERAEEKMVEVLTETQRKKYRELQGKDFEFQDAGTPTPVEAPAEAEPEKPEKPR